MPVQLDDLRESNEFLNSLIDSINSAVFVVNREMRIQQFNSALKSLFSLHQEKIVGELCGNTIGCVFALTENNPCGRTSYCSQCQLRYAAIKAMTENVPTIRQRIDRDFFIDGKPVLKHLEISTKLISFHGEEMTLVIVDDVTESELQKRGLIEKQRRLDEDMKAAATIQQSLLPQKQPQVPTLNIAWKFMPCDLIGGDIFNIFRLDDAFLGCYMLDVSGHGVPSAMVTVSISRALEPSRLDYELISPSEVCETLDKEYPLHRFRKFMSIIYLIMNYREGYFVYSNAGRPPLALLHRNGEMELLDEGGPIIGLEGTTFNEGFKRLKTGDRLFLYTDGLIEHRNEQGELYGEERLYAHLKALGNHPLQAAIDEVVQSVVQFGEGRELQDDVSLLGMEYTGGAEESEEGGNP